MTRSSAASPPPPASRRLARGPKFLRGRPLPTPARRAPNPTARPMLSSDHRERSTWNRADRWHIEVTYASDRPGDVAAIHSVWSDSRQAEQCRARTRPRLHLSAAPRLLACWLRLAGRSHEIAAFRARSHSAASRPGDAPAQELLRPAARDENVVGPPLLGTPTLPIIRISLRERRCGSGHRAFVDPPTIPFRTRSLARSRNSSPRNRAPVRVPRGTRQPPGEPPPAKRALRRAVERPRRAHPSRPAASDQTGFRRHPRATAGRSNRPGGDKPSLPRVERPGTRAVRHPIAAPAARVEAVRRHWAGGTRVPSKSSRRCLWFAVGPSVQRVQAGDR